jgi:hypothetical protein
MSTAPTIPPWLSRLIPAEHERLSIAVRSFGEAWRLFWNAQCLSVGRILRGEERPLEQVVAEQLVQAFDKARPPERALFRLKEAVEGLAQLGAEVPSHVQNALDAGCYDIAVRDRPPSQRSELTKLLSDFRQVERRGRKWAERLLALIAANKQPPRQEEWLPASQAVDQAERAGHRISLAWVSKYAEKNGVRMRPRQLDGNHRREVEWYSLMGFLTKRKAEGGDADTGNGPTARERDVIEARLKEARKKKRLDRSAD